MNITDLSSKPPLTQGLRLELHLKEVKNFPQLTLRLIVVILKSLSHNVVLIDASVKETVPWVNPWSIKKKELVSSLEDKSFVCSSDGFQVFGFIRIRWWGLVAGPSVFGSITGVIIVGDIIKLATETLQFSLHCVLVDFVLPGNLQDSHMVSWKSWSDRCSPWASQLEKNLCWVPAHSQILRNMKN